MYRQIGQVLLQYGYEGVSLNVPDIYLALHQEGGEGYAVVTIDETAGTLLSQEQFYHVSVQIRSFLQKRGCSYFHFLYLLVSEEEGSIHRLFQNYECFWRIVPSKGQVMVFEDADEAFMVLRRPLEDLFARQGNQRQSQGGYGQGERSYGQGDYGQEAGSYGYGNYRQEAGGYRQESGQQDIGKDGQRAGGLPGRLKAAWQDGNFPLCNILIIVVNLLIFLYTDFFAFLSGQDMVDAGALGWYEVFRQGQWYRLFTSMFLHINIEHIFNNMLVLFFVGSGLEPEIGRLKYGILYLGSGLLAGCASMVYNMVRNDYVVSVGASGAIFGTVGAMLFLVLSHRGKRGQYTVRQIAWMAFLSLYGGFASQGVDNMAHFGGFVAGFLLAMLLTPVQRQD